MSRALRAALWCGLLVLALVVILGRHHIPVAAVHGDDDDAPAVALVQSAYSRWSAVELLYRGERTRFERDADGQWFVHPAAAQSPADHAHQVDPAFATRLDQTLATFSRTRIERSLPVDPAQLAVYDLDNPALIVLIYAPDGQVVNNLEVGALAADGFGRYVHLASGGEVHLIPNFQVEGLLALLIRRPEAASSAR